MSSPSGECANKELDVVFALDQRDFSLGWEELVNESLRDGKLFLEASHALLRLGRFEKGEVCAPLACESLHGRP